MIVEEVNIGMNEIKEEFKKSKKSLLIFDYDGTLVDFSNRVDYTVPKDGLFNILKTFTDSTSCDVIISSGRDKNYMEKWFSDKNIFLFAEHGVFFKIPSNEWSSILSDDRRWFDRVKFILEKYTKETKNSFLEIKDYSFSWHYRSVEPQFAEIKLKDLKNELFKVLSDYPDIGVMEGALVLEVKNKKINKGIGLNHFLSNKKYDFILCAGDDKTDEYMFEVLPEEAFTIKVREGESIARYRLNSFVELNMFLKELGALL